LLFISHIYICLFLPLSLLGFHLLVRKNRAALSLAWLITASLFFYGWWNPQYLVLIVASVLFNFFLGHRMSLRAPGSAKLELGLALLGNIGLLGYFKYANFFVEATNQIFGSGYHLETIILPLAISFFTLQQVGYVVDAYRGKSPPYQFLQYCLFVVFFPQLIAGPIVHHRKLIPQFTADKLSRFDVNNMALGVSIFFVGMFKKVLLADSLIPWVAAAFDAPTGETLGAWEAWIGTYAYSFQLYFDFSGYSDMAIGAALLFNIRLPVNFNSPYKAASIREIWRHWHITLSDFVMRYVYGSLGSNKKGAARQYVNLFVAFLATGIWHGAGWTFVVFGCMHGSAVLLHQAWKDLGGGMPRWLGVLLTYNFWTLALVVFRSPDMTHATHVYSTMFGSAAWMLPTVSQVYSLLWLLVLLGFVWVLPNTSEVYREPGKERVGSFWRWEPNARWGYFMAVIALLLLYRPLGQMNADQAFIYFQF
jgi:alginate O-acetyltransferase complex protein AlgI